MPRKNTIDHETRREHLEELIAESLKRNKGNYSYNKVDAIREAAAKVGLCYKQAKKALLPYEPEKNQSVKIQSPLSQLTLFNNL
ncbi:hypothetical protein WH52_01345 [Tenacibaculum holothuriorum]|uniref:Uncharacterized protein n=1 Tax=Tenacibaculum holothuriorum TaxID=1635173 RepID=A0A1Y2PFR0_9FLAO|nr:hypothetical protein [Tenacibaculum holothuriorum]OSY89312.1 hypothetical protein WH52_01345 [Tenacibaculum holothuriorum]